MNRLGKLCAIKACFRIVKLSSKMPGTRIQAGKAAQPLESVVAAPFDHRRRPQLSTSRITVQDLVPYFQLSYSYDEILQIMPSLSVPEIQAVERYVDEHREEVMEQDRRIRERNATRRNPPQVEESRRRVREKWPALQKLYDKFYGQGPNGDGHSG